MGIYSILRYAKRFGPQNVGGFRPREPHTEPKACQRTRVARRALWPGPKPCGSHHLPRLGGAEGCGAGAGPPESLGLAVP